MRTRTYPNTVRELANLADAVNRNFNRYAPNYDYAGNGGSNGRAQLTLPVDIWTTENAYHISAYLPGVDPEAVEITFAEDKLTIRGSFPGLAGSERVDESDQVAEEASDSTTEETNRGSQNLDTVNDVKYIRRELYHGSFERTLSFNVPVNADAIVATFKHGVLTLDVPKAEEILPKQIKIQVA